MSTIIEAVEFWLRKSKLKIEAVTRPVLDKSFLDLPHNTSVLEDVGLFISHFLQHGE